MVTKATGQIKSSMIAAASDLSWRQMRKTTPWRRGFLFEKFNKKIIFIKYKEDIYETH